MTPDLALRPVTGLETPRAPQRSEARHAAEPAPAPAPATPNPRLRLDGSLGLVVIEFRNQGDTVATLPTPREIEAYRAAVVTNAPLPVGTPPLEPAGGAEA